MSKTSTKGRSLQVLVAEKLSSACQLSIEACYPVRSGDRENRSFYVAEGRSPDIRIRSSSQNGLDVVPLTRRAAECLSILGKPLAIECKFYKKDSWGGGTFWAKGQPPACVFEGITQTKASLANWLKASILVVNKTNFIDPVASLVVPVESEMMGLVVMSAKKGLPFVVSYDNDGYWILSWAFKDFVDEVLLE